MTRLQTLAAIVWLTFQPVLFHWQALISRTTYIPFDLPGFHTPVASVVVEAIRQHRLPLWDPYIYGGYPIHADIQAQILYPPAWPVFLKSALSREHTLLYWLEWETVLHISLAGLLTAWLLRRSGCGWWAALFGATVYQLGCFFSAQVQHLGAVCGAAWMPLAWLGVAELARGFTARWFAAVAAALAMGFLAGFPAITLIVFGSTLAVAAGHWCSRRARVTLLVWTVAAMAASLLLVAAQLVPTSIWSAHSVSGQRWMWNSGGGLPPRVLLSTLWPDWFHVLTSERYREPYDITFMYLYNGQAALWLALAAPWLSSRLPARLFATLTGFFTLVMLGNAIPGYHFLFGLLPRVARGASYVEFGTAAFSLAIALAAAYALEHLTRGRRAWIGAAVALATSSELAMVVSNRMMNATRGDWRLVDSPRTYFERDWLLWQLKDWLQSTVPPQRTDTMQQDYRLVTVAPAVRLPTLSGDNPFAPLRMMEYRKLFCQGNPWARFYIVSDPASPLLDAGNVGFLLLMGDGVDEAKLKQAGWDRIPWELPIPLKVFRNREALPRYFLVGRVRRAGSPAEAQGLLRNFDPRLEAVVEGSVSGGGDEVGEFAPVSVVSYRPDRVELRTSATRPAYLVAAESWAPGWESQVDGRPAALYPTNLAFQGIPLPAGRHQVTLEYVPRPAYVALGVSGLAWLALAACVWRARSGLPNQVSSGELKRR